MFGNSVRYPKDFSDPGVCEIIARSQNRFAMPLDPLPPHVKVDVQQRPRHLRKIGRLFRTDADPPPQTELNIEIGARGDPANETILVVGRLFRTHPTWKTFTIHLCKHTFTYIKRQTDTPTYRPTHTYMLTNPHSYMHTCIPTTYM